MELDLKYYGRSPHKIIELIIESSDTTVVEDITDLRGFVDKQLIDDLRFIADELEENNEKLEEDD